MSRARNRVLLREVNRRIASLGTTYRRDSARPWILLCECGNPSCSARVKIHFLAYRAIRENPERFIIAPDHLDRDAMEVAVQRANYLVVEAESEPLETPRTHPRVHFPAPIPRRSK